jgi:hypothetical protein
MISLSIFKILLATMLEWKEREHESDDFSTLQDQQTVNALIKPWVVKVLQNP